MWGLWQVRFASWNHDVVEAATQIAHEPVSLADHLGTGQRLEAAHRPSPPFQMLMVALDPLLHLLASDVRDLRQDGSKRGWVDRCSVYHRQRGHNLGAFDCTCQERGSCGKGLCKVIEDETGTRMSYDDAV